MRLALASAALLLLGACGGSAPPGFPPETYGVASRAAAEEDIRAGPLPYGRVARACGRPPRDLGREIARHPERRPRYRLYDSRPGTAAPRSFYVTGFDDGCARRFTAAMAMFGSVGMHETLRYGRPADQQPYSHTDRAYETLKSAICRAPRQKPCGRRLGRLERGTVFLSIYENFGGNRTWFNLLLHDGQVVAQDMKG